jgi:UDP-N-acetylglucosamine 1-carboxyvinyltransferase
MDAIKVRSGKTPLRGTVRISGAKNAALPILCATLLSDGASRLRNVPDLRDITTTAALLRFLGRDVKVAPPEVTLEAASGKVRPEAPYELVKQMRASVLVLGPLVARYGRAKVSLPGGCQIGARPIDQHLKGLEAMGCSIHLERGYVIAEGPGGGGRLRGADFAFDLPTVTGTENIMMAAALAKGRTTLVNCAREPEVE